MEWERHTNLLFISHWAAEIEDAQSIFTEAKEKKPSATQMNPIGPNLGNDWRSFRERTSFFFFMNESIMKFTEIFQKTLKYSFKRYEYDVWDF